MMKAFTSNTIELCILYRSHILEKIFDLCKNEAKNWKLCEAGDVSFESETQRGPLNHGPARRVAERPLVIVVGTFDIRCLREIVLQMLICLSPLTAKSCFLTNPIILGPRHTMTLWLALCLSYTRTIIV